MDETIKTAGFGKYREFFAVVGAVPGAEFDDDFGIAIGDAKANVFFAVFEAVAEEGGIVDEDAVFDVGFFAVLVKKLH